MDRRILVMKVFLKLFYEVLIIQIAFHIYNCHDSVLNSSLYNLCRIHCHNDDNLLVRLKHPSIAYKIPPKHIFVFLSPLIKSSCINLEFKYRKMFTVNSLIFLIVK